MPKVSNDPIGELLLILAALIFWPLIIAAVLACIGSLVAAWPLWLIIWLINESDKRKGIDE